VLITANEVSIQTGQTYEGADLERVNAFIVDVSAAIETFCRKTFTEPVPQAVKAVAMIEVRRLLNTEPGVSTERIADLSTGYAYGGAAVLLSNGSKEDLKNYLRWKRSSSGSIRLVSPDYVESMLSRHLPRPYDVDAPELVNGPATFRVSGRTAVEGLVQVQYTSNGIDWQDHKYVQSQDISDGGRPFWYADFIGTASSATYKWRARFRLDGDTSAWSDPVTVEYEVA